MESFKREQLDCKIASRIKENSEIEGKIQALRASLEQQQNNNSNVRSATFDCHSPRIIHFIQFLLFYLFLFQLSQDRETKSRMIILRKKNCLLAYSRKQKDEINRLREELDRLQKRNVPFFSSVE